MNQLFFSRRSFLTLATGLSAGFALASCSQYTPEGATKPTGISQANIVAKINATRAANGRKPLRYNATLAKAATTHARLMAARGELSHSLGGTLRERVTAAGYQGAVGENLAGGQRTLELAIKGWLNSTGHRSTLLSDRFEEFGLAVANGGGTHKIYWAMILGGSFDAWRG